MTKSWPRIVWGRRPVIRKVASDGQLVGQRPEDKAFIVTGAGFLGPGGATAKLSIHIRNGRHPRQPASAIALLRKVDA